MVISMRENRHAGLREIFALVPAQFNETRAVLLLGQRYRYAGCDFPSSTFRLPDGPATSTAAS